MNNELRGLTGDILLEAGTNEFEVLVFRLGDQGFGVNVAKVREVIPPRRTIDIPCKHPSVIGLFEVRGSVLTLIDLRLHLGVPESTQTDSDHKDNIIITEFNGVRIGFKVDGVERIHRVNWDRLLPPPRVAFKDSTGSETISSTTGVIDLDGSLVLLVDFESVADAILMEKKLAATMVENSLGIERENKRVIVAEDSPFMRNQIRRIMEASGYTKMEIYSDGKEAWDAITQDGPPIDAIISDIEMPRMDGLHLTKLIKESSKLKDIPVVLFSSLISEDNINKGQQVGATVQIPKPELPEMVTLVDRVVSGEIVDQTNVGGLQVA